MNKTEILKKVEPIIELFANDKEFKISELFDPAIWLSYPKTDKEEIAVIFSELVNEDLKDRVETKKTNTDKLLQVYKKTGIKKVKKAKNIFPNEPVSIRRNERGNA